MVSRVLVTGSQGFTGQYMVDELENAGYEVFGLGCHPDDTRGYIQADLTNAESVMQAVQSVQPDAVIHLAALAFVGHGDPNSFYQVNLIGTRNLLAALSGLSKKPEVVVLASSANVYGNQSEGVISEATPVAPVNDYAVSKLAMEFMAKTWLPQLPIVITRPFNYTGVGQADHFLLPKIVAHFRQKRPVIELGNLDVWRDFSDVRSVVSAYRALIEKKPVGEILNVASVQARSLREVIALCTDITGHAIEVKVNPAFVRANEVKTLCGDVSRLRDCIGDWQSPDLEATLRWMLSEGL